MSIIIKTANPNVFINRIKTLMKENLITSWGCDDDGDFTCVGSLENTAWFRPKTERDTVVFFLIGRKGVPLTNTDYSSFHGKLVDMLLRTDFPSLGVKELVVKYPTQNNYKADEMCLENIVSNEEY